MEKLIVRTAAIFLFLLSWNDALFAQVNADSLRVVREALQMIAFPKPEFNEPFMPDLSPEAMADLGFEQPYQSKAVKFQVRDGAQIHGQKYEHTSNKTILLLHGTLGSSYTFNKTSGLLREVLEANVIAIDLRGHGQSAGRPGDVSTPNQYAEDLDDIIASIRTENPDETILLAGHSMGGGIVLRHAETFPNTQVDGYLLFAPNLGNSAPTTSRNLDLDNNFIKSHLSRGLGLRMLNEYGIHQYDSLEVVFYNMPEQFPLRSYSYRSMEASVPTDYRQALRMTDQPLLMLVGSEDEAFVAEEYPPLFKAYSQGECYLIEGETHNGIRHSKVAMERIRNWAVESGL